MKHLALVLLAFLFASIGNAATSVAYVDGRSAQTIYIAWNQPNQATADSFALKGCRDAAKKSGSKAGEKCAVSSRYTDLGAGAVVCGQGGCAWVVGQPSEQEAADQAYRDCVGQGKGNCNATNITTWTEKVGDGKPARSHAAPAKQCSPPAGRAVRSTTHCNNGACSRTFDNGCTVQFEAPYCHNPFTGQWEWKPDGC
jgi:hypothetical protein